MSKNMHPEAKVKEKRGGLVQPRGSAAVSKFMHPKAKVKAKGKGLVQPHDSAVVPNYVHPKAKVEAGRTGPLRPRGSARISIESTLWYKSGSVVLATKMNVKSPGRIVFVSDSVGLVSICKQLCFQVHDACACGSACLLSKRNLLSAKKIASGTLID